METIVLRFPTTLPCWLPSGPLASMAGGEMQLMVIFDLCRSSPLPGLTCQNLSLQDYEYWGDPRSCRASKIPWLGTSLSGISLARRRWWTRALMVLSLSSLWETVKEFLRWVVWRMYLFLTRTKYSSKRSFFQTSHQFIILPWQVLTELLSFLPPFPVWKAGNLGEAGANHVDLENLENLGGKERIVIASVGDQAKEASKLVMEERQEENNWIIITSIPPEHSWTRAFQSGFIIEDKVVINFFLLQNIYKIIYFRRGKCGRW